MDRGAWWAIQPMGSQGVRHDWATKPSADAAGLSRVWAETSEPAAFFKGPLSQTHMSVRGSQPDVADLCMLFWGRLSGPPPVPIVGFVVQNQVQQKATQHGERIVLQLKIKKWNWKREPPSIRAAFQAVQQGKGNWMAVRAGGAFVSWVSGLWVVGAVWVSSSCPVTAVEGARGR